VSRPQQVQTYRLHKPSGQAVVTLRLSSGDRKDVYLGEYNSPKSRQEYGRIIAELASTSGPNHVAGPITRNDPTVSEILLAFFRWAATHYRTPAGDPTSEIGELKWSLRPVRELYSHIQAREFGPRSLAAIRQHMIKLGWCRSLINRRIDRVKRAFKWAASEELVPVTCYEALRTLAGLRRGRTEA
jgi:hypothetical protein